LPPIEAMFRSCADAPASSVCEITGNRVTTPAAPGHVAHPRQRADPQPAVRQVLDPGQRQVIDVH
jgi:hypothetical protein